ncbi:MAG: hypothetical protein ABIO05_02750 [Ferruginibacter sp.]
MRSIKLLSILLLVIAALSCSELKKTSNTTGKVFSLNGQWELSANSPENTLVGSRVMVAPFIAEGRFTTLANNTQCYRDNDIKWKNLATNNNGGFLLNNLLSSCSTGSLNYQPASITVINSNEIRLTGRNINGQDNTQTWKRVVQ